MTEFDAALSRFAALDEEALGRPWSFRGQMMDVRYALYRTIEDAQEAQVQVVGRPLPESRRILSFAQRAFGDLRGLLVGLPAALIDRAPGTGEWPVREVLRHMWVVERRYALQTLYALERADSDPVRIADDRLPTPAQMDVTGGIGEVLARLGEARAESNRRLGDVAPALMTRPTIWARYDADVRFRLHRFAAHIASSTGEGSGLLGERRPRRAQVLAGADDASGHADLGGLAPRAGIVGLLLADLAVDLQHAVVVLQHVVRDGAREVVLGVGVDVHLHHAVVQRLPDLLQQ